MLRRSPRRVPVALAALLAVLPGATTLAQSPSAAPADAIRLLAVRPIELPGGRIASMSPDGRFLAHVRPAVGYQRGELCTVSVETLVDQACADLSRLDAGLRLEDLVWAPDGSALAFSEVAFVTLRDGDLWRMDALTGELTNLDDDGFEGSIPMRSGDGAEGSVTLPVNPAFSPDGSQVAFSRSVLEPDGSRRNAIAVVPATGGEVTEIDVIDDELPGIVYFGIRWAPDGEHLFVSVTSPERDDLRNGIWMLRADGRGSARLVVPRTQETAGPAVVGVSADGRTLLVQDPMALGLFGGGEFWTWATVDVDTGRVSPLWPVDADPRGATVTLAGLSPDGRHVVTVQNEGPEQNRVHVRAVGSDDGPALLDEPLEAAGAIERLLTAPWATNGTILLTGAGRFETATLLTVEGGQPEP